MSAKSFAKLILKCVKVHESSFDETLLEKDRALHEANDEDCEEFRPRERAAYCRVSLRQAVLDNAGELAQPIYSFLRDDYAFAVSWAHEHK